jgi:hypothetical protein
MQLPFTAEQFAEVFRAYNLSAFPMQIILFLMGVFVVYMALKQRSRTDQVISIILAFFWIWIGIFYHIIHFTPINKAAYLFGLLFILQGFLFFHLGVRKRKLSFNYKHGIYGFTGGLLILYAMLIYPVLGYMMGHIYPSSPTFGLPCPTVIFTFGILLWTDERLPKSILIIPFLWALLGFSAAFLLGYKEDIGLIFSAVICTILIFIRDRKHIDRKTISFTQPHKL